MPPCLASFPWRIGAPSGPLEPSPKRDKGSRTSPHAREKWPERVIYEVQRRCDPLWMVWPQPADARTFLIVDDDERVRAMVRFTLELEGLTVIEASSLVQARHMLGPEITGIVLDRQLPDGDGLDLLPDIGRLSPAARVVVCSALLYGREPPGLNRIDKSDME